VSQRQSEPAAGSSARAVVDGRRLRSERTRQAIIDAYLSLLRENPQIPTSAQIAERSGYSVRSIFERFPDLLRLRIAATDHAFSVGSAQATPRDVDGDRQTRLRSHVEMRARTCDQWLPLWRALNANQGESIELKLRIKLIREAIRHRIEVMYKPELATLPARQREHMLIAIENITDFESWGRMREYHKLSVEEACAVWTRAIDRLLPPTPAT
jgi:AcrR family transcriptional regulator